MGASRRGSSHLVGIAVIFDTLVDRRGVEVSVGGGLSVRPKSLLLVSFLDVQLIHGGLLVGSFLLLLGATLGEPGVV